MLPRKTALFLALLFLLVATGEMVNAREIPRPEKYRVKFLATSWFTRGTWGRNEDTYLVEIQSTGNEPAFIAYLIDTYRNEVPPLSADMLESENGTSFSLTRDVHCDAPFGQIALRTKPGDLMAILPARLNYRPPLKSLPSPGTVVPCFRSARN